MHTFSMQCQGAWLIVEYCTSSLCVLSEMRSEDDTPAAMARMMMMMVVLAASAAGFD